MRAGGILAEEALEDIVGGLCKDLVW
jgi:hypothetical protein